MDEKNVLLPTAVILWALIPLTTPQTKAIDILYLISNPPSLRHEV